MYSRGHKNLIEFGQSVKEALCEIFDSGSKIVIPFTESMAKNLCLKKNLDYSEVVNEFITYFKLYQISDELCNLASCTFQVIVAYKCVATGIAAYNCELSNFLYTSESTLQDIYKGNPIVNGKYISIPKQENLWISVKSYLKETCNFELCIPPQKSWSGRYVQYPKSQQLFSLSDYKKYEDKFKSFGLNHNEHYTFKEFAERVFGKKTKAFINNYYVDYLDPVRLEEITRRVIFYCFCIWTEQYIKKEITKQQQNRTIKPKSDDDRYHIQLNISDNSFSLFKNNQRLLQLRNEDFRRIEKETFIYDEIYEIWEKDNCKLSETDTIGTCFSKTQARNYKFLDELTPYRFDNDNDLFFFIILEEYWKNIFHRFIPNENNKELFIGGIKHNNGAWIPGLFPLLKTKNRKYFFIDSKKIYLEDELYNLNDYDQLNTPGLHFLKLPEETPIPFMVSDEKCKDRENRGWVWTKNGTFSSLSNEWNISGLNLCNKFFVKTKKSSNSFWGNINMERISHRFDNIIK